uniref:Uncharacterized protein n=1 Tax=Anguilla anguilla TaxID=7936 RepID=A0A0E9VS52_ANGAN
MMIHSLVPCRKNRSDRGCISCLLRAGASASLH